MRLIAWMERPTLSNIHPSRTLASHLRWSAYGVRARRLSQIAAAETRPLALGSFGGVGGASAP
eukprot:3462047-Pleurochrysis_carterae.AAC.2